KRKPPWALAVAENAPTGVTGRVGPVMAPGFPRDEAWFHHRLGRNPPAAPQSLSKTSESRWMVARCQQKPTQKTKIDD
ncbi:MAG: hypothetical protein ACLQDY_21625, partial [Streptosporangiaceae bacterium]